MPKSIYITFTPFYTKLVKSVTLYRNCVDFFTSRERPNITEAVSFATEKYAERTAWP